MDLRPTEANILAKTMRDAKGNIPSAVREELSDWCRSTSSTANKFGRALMTRFETTEMGVQLPLGEPGKRQARIIFEVDTTEDMCDTSGNLSSGCIASIVDWSTSIACRLLVLYLDPGLPLHVSLSLGVTNHTPAPLGCRLQIVSTTVSFNAQTADSKTEIFDKTHGRRIASGWHTKMVPSVVKL